LPDSLNFFLSNYVYIHRPPKRLESAVDLTDEALITKYIEDGDIKIFKTLVRRYQSRVYATAYRILGNTEEAEEITQDAFVKVHHNIEKYRQASAFSSWIFQITRNLCMDVLRVRQRKKDLTVVSFDPQAIGPEDDASQSSRTLTQLADPKPGPAQHLDEEEQAKIIEQKLNLLPESQKTVLVLHDIEGLSYQEIADTVGTSIGTVRSRLHYGRIKLKELLDPYFSSDYKTSPLTSR
jgi:RNA polymerase sigma-70 factor (ECF subfamily)